MILPIGDTPNPSRTPWATWLLLSVNVAVFVLLTLPRVLTPADPAGLAALTAVFGAIPQVATAWDVFVLEHGFQTGAPGVLDLLTSLFMHAGLAHLAGNLLFLWIFGDNVEARLGSVPFLLFYLVCGAAATGLYALLAGPSLVPLVGASGAISGVLGAYLLWFPHNRVKLFVGLWPIWLDIILVPAWVVLGSYLVLDNVLPLLLGAGGNVAYGAHVGGFLAGLAVAGALGRSRAAGLEGGEREISLGRSALKAGDLAGAYQHLIRAAQDPSPVVRERALRELAKIPDPRLQAWIASRHQV